MTMNGILASALIGAVAVIVGLIIIQLTPEDRPKP
jgi:hypothetical protein